MAIRKVKRNSYTKIANPRRKKRRKKRKNGTHAGARRKTARRAYMKSNPKRKRRSTRKGGIRKTARKAYKRNPKMKGLVVAGVDMAPVAIGAAAAIALKSVFSVGFFKTGVLDKVANPTLKAALPSVGGILVGVLLHKMGKGYAKKIGGFTAAASLVLLIDDVAGKQIEGVFSKAGGSFHQYGGAWEQMNGAGDGMSGAFFESPKGLSGAYVMPKAGTAMFGGISNLG